MKIFELGNFMVLHDLGVLSWEFLMLGENELGLGFNSDHNRVWF